METEIKEHPIIFSGEMVRAILAGWKTQTRRIIKPQLEHWPETENGWEWNGHTPKDRKKHGACCTNGVSGYEEVKRFFSIFMQKSCPYGVPGDRLWVREKWRPVFGILRQPWEKYGNEYGVQYADISEPFVTENAKKPFNPDKQFNWSPSIHMPRWASRILLEVTGVRVERVQDISREDAKEEGIWPSPLDGLEHAGGRKFGNAEKAFQFLWGSINEKRGYGWDVNPWIWVVEFKVVGNPNPESPGDE